MMMHVWMWPRSLVVGLALMTIGCGDDDGTQTPGTASDASAGTVTGTHEMPGGELLGCRAGSVCTLVLVSETLDDRVEVFSPDDPDGNVYRGSIDLDLKPGIDVGDDGLDEPFGLTLAGGYLHVLVGHYPERDSGSLVSFPYALFGERAAGSRIAAAEYFAGGTFSGGVVYTPLGEVEPIFMLPEPVQGRLLVAAFANDLFADEASWTMPGRLVVIDPAAPAEFGVRELVGLEGGECWGASEVVGVGPGRVAVACDGNEAVAFLDVGTVGTGSPEAAAAAIGGRLCDLIPSDSRRVRSLAPDGAGGVVVGEGPTPLTLLSNAVLNYIDGNNCNMLGAPTLVGSNGQSQLGQVVLLAGGQRPTFLFASGQGRLAEGNRGVYVARDGAQAGLEVCGPVAGFDEFWTTPGEPLDPVALALSGDGKHLVVGAGPADTQGPGGIYGRVLWATLEGPEDPCTMSANVVDLSALAPVVASDPATHRRAPSVVVIRTVAG